MFSDAQYTESLMPINYVLLCVVSGIIGLVLTGFTGWHLSLAYRGQTTIECLEKTRYLSPLRKSMRKQHLGIANGHGQSYGQQLAVIHANSLPGVTRLEEGEAMFGDEDIEEGQGVKARDPSRRNYNDIERSRERERYEDYLDEQDSEKLPSAFDLGWRMNLRHLFGPTPLLRCLPICNTSGDGWHWEPSQHWLEARENIRRERESQWEERENRGHNGNGAQPGGLHQTWPSGGESDRHYMATSNGVNAVSKTGKRSPSKADRILGRTNEYFDRNYDEGSPSSRMSMKTLRRRGSFSENSDDDDDNYDVSSDDDRGLFEDRDDRTGHAHEISPFIGQQKAGDSSRKLD